MTNLFGRDWINIAKKNPTLYGWLLESGYKPRIRPPPVPNGPWNRNPQPPSQPRNENHIITINDPDIEMKTQPEPSPPVNEDDDAKQEILEETPKGPPPFHPNGPPPPPPKGPPPPPSGTSSHEKPWHSEARRLLKIHGGDPIRVANILSAKKIASFDEVHQYFNPFAVGDTPTETLIQNTGTSEITAGLNSQSNDNSFSNQFMPKREGISFNTEQAAKLQNNLGAYRKASAWDEDSDGGEQDIDYQDNWQKSSADEIAASRAKIEANTKLQQQRLINKKQALASQGVEVGNDAVGDLTQIDLGRGMNQFASMALNEADDGDSSGDSGDWDV